MLENARVPVLGFAAASGTGKTTLLAAVIPRLRAAGLEIALVKQAHPRFDVDHPGKDSYELRHAGARRVLLTSTRRYALMVERPVERDAGLDEMLAALDQDGIDLVLVEGFARERFPKIEIRRSAVAGPPLFPRDDAVVAIAADAPPEGACALPVLDLDDPRAVADFVLEWLSAQRASAGR